VDDEIEVASRPTGPSPQWATTPGDLDALMNQAGLTIKQKALVLLYSMTVAWIAVRSNGKKYWKPVFSPTDVADMIAGTAEEPGNPTAHRREVLDAIAELVSPWAGKSISKQAVAQGTQKALAKLGGRMASAPPPDPATVHADIEEHRRYHHAALVAAY